MTGEQTQAAQSAEAAATGVVVIPALNEERAIRAVLTAALRYCAKVILVDDGSSDRTSEVVADLPLERIRHAAPQGKAMALRDGFELALKLGADGVLTMDGDGQHDAADLPRLLAAAKEYPNHIVIGARLLGKDAQPDKNRFGNAQADFWVSWACGQRIVDTQSGQRYYPRESMEIALRLPDAGFVFESEILIEAAAHGIHAVSVPIAIRYEEGARASHFRPFRDVLRITRMIAGRLARQGFKPSGLMRSLTRPPVVFDPNREVG